MRLLPYERSLSKTRQIPFLVPVEVPSMKKVVTLLVVFLFATLSFAQVAKEAPDLRPDGKGHGAKVDHDAKARLRTGNGISYHGGPVMLGTVTAYYIWYGNWSGNTAESILPDFIGHEGGSAYYNINTTYFNGSNQHVSNAIAYGGSTSDNYSHGTALSDSGVQAVVTSALSKGSLPTSSNAVYFVLTSKDVNETSGFCTQYCGWHTAATINGKNIKYAFVGNPDRCPSACEEQSASSPNNNPGADGMASIIAHEFEESTSDPDLNAWYDNRGEENADKCAWTFGTESTASNGSKYNLTLSDGSRWLIQRNWVNASGGFCSMSH
jgi:Phosphate-induced protein 1 conserved region